MSNRPRARPNLRPDHNGTQRAQFESNKKKIYATQNICGICGQPVDFAFRFPHPQISRAFLKTELQCAVSARLTSSIFWCIIILYFSRRGQTIV